MKNHLSIDGSIGAGARCSPLGMLSVDGSTRSGEWGTVVLVLCGLLIFWNIIVNR